MRRQRDGEKGPSVRLIQVRRGVELALGYHHLIRTGTGTIEAGAEGIIWAVHHVRVI
jgi:hypothetical protein